MTTNLKEYFDRNVFILGILFLVGFLVYGNVVYGPFLFDDNLLVENNVLITSLKNFWQFFVSHSQSGAGIEGSNFYRPLQYLVYTINYQIFGLNAFSYHLVSIILHIINAFLIFLVLQKLNFSRISSFIAAIFFIIIPVNVEAVSYISGLADPLGFFFLFLGILKFLSLDEEKVSGVVQVFVFFILALLSKESTIIFFPLCLLIVIFIWDDITKKQRDHYLKILGGLLLLLIFYLILKFTVFNFTGNIGLTGEQNVYTENILVRAATFINILWEYAKLIVFPIHLFLEKPYEAFPGIFSLRALFGLVIIFGGLYLSYRSFYRERIFFLGFFWFFIALAPLSGIIPLNAMFLEHWLYFPIVGILIIFAGIWDLTEDRRMKAVILSILIIFGMFFAGRTIIRNIEWANPEKFYQNELKYSPGSARVHNNLAMEYSDQKEYELAIAQYEKAIEIFDEYPQTHHNLANIYAEKMNYEKAEKEYFIAIKMNPNFMYSYVGLWEMYEITNPGKAEIMKKFLEKVNNGEEVTEEEYNEILNLQNEE